MASNNSPKPKLEDLRALKEDFLICRVRRHRWSPIQDDGGVGRSYKESNTVARVAGRCDRCTTIRYEAWSKITGDLLFSHFKYPKGYGLPGAHIKPKNVRKEYLGRVGQ